jgi:hypothetical protein
MVRHCAAEVGRPGERSDGARFPREPAVGRRREVGCRENLARPASLRKIGEERTNRRMVPGTSAIGQERRNLPWSSAEAAFIMGQRAGLGESAVDISSRRGDKAARFGDLRVLGAFRIASVDMRGS